MIGIGALVGVGLILLDAILGVMKKLRIPPLAVGIGIYLPMSATFAVVVGAVISYWYSHRAKATANPERTERLGTLVASALIVGESLWGVSTPASSSVSRGTRRSRLYLRTSLWVPGSDCSGLWA